MSLMDDINAPRPDWVRSAVRSCADPRATARALRDVIERGAAESERIGRLCDDTARALCESGLFGLLVPAELGGIEADPATYVDAVEELSYADGSVGWVMIATTFCIAGACSWLGPSAIDAMYGMGDGGPRGFIAAAQIGLHGTAVREGDGYRIRGQFHFGSGSQLSSWFMGAFVLHEDGAPALTAEGRPHVLFIYAPRENVELDPMSWDVTGLRATASHDFRFLDQWVHDDFVMFPPRRPRRGGPAFDIGVSLGHVTWSLGVGTRILDEIAALAQRKQRPGRQTLIDQPTFQRDFGMHRAAMEAARASVRKVYADWFAAAAEHGSAPLEVRARARLTACWATKVAAEAGQFAYLAAGTDGLRNTENNVLQRCHRDLQASAVHRHVDDNVLIESSGVLLGVPRPGLEL